MKEKGLEWLVWFFWATIPPLTSWGVVKWGVSRIDDLRSAKRKCTKGSGVFKRWTSYFTVAMSIVLFGVLLAKGIVEVKAGSWSSPIFLVASALTMGASYHCLLDFHDDRQIKKIGAFALTALGILVVAFGYYSINL